MNNKDDFGQYTCIAENVHGRMETIVFVLEESMTTTMTSERTHRLSKHYSSKSFSNRSLIRMSKNKGSLNKVYLLFLGTRTTTIRTSSISLERGIQLSSSSPHRFTSRLIFFGLLFRTIFFN